MLYSWLFLLLAILAEVAGTLCLRLSEGLTRFWPDVGVVSFYILSFAALSLAIRRIELGVAYAIWAGLGIVLLTVASRFIFAQSLSLVQIAFMGLILMGVIGLNLTSH